MSGRSRSSIRFVAFAMMLFCTAALTETRVAGQALQGAVYGAGDNTWGELAIGRGMPGTINTSTIAVATLYGGSQSISVGGWHSLVVQYDGSVWASGMNSHCGNGTVPTGQLGDGTTTDRTAPVQVWGAGPGSGFTAVAAGGCHSLALKNDGTVWGWGANDSGQVGMGTTSDGQTTPVQVSGLTNVIAIAAGSAFSLALKSDGTVWAWGDNRKAQLGDGSWTSDFERLYDFRSTPVQVHLPYVERRTNRELGVTAISAGIEHAFALTRDGAIWGWGKDDLGQVGKSCGYYCYIPGIVFSSGFAAIGAGWKHSVALHQDGSIWTWGYNGWGQIGNGQVEGANSGMYPPTRVMPAGTAVVIAAGGQHCLAIDPSGRVFGWGLNNWGELGDGTATSTGSPVFMKVPGSTGIRSGDRVQLIPINYVTRIAAGWFSSLVIRDVGN